MTAPSGATPYDLHGRVALVTGGAGGLGQAVSAAFAGAGATVIIVESAQQRAAAEAMIAAASARGERMSYLAADVLDEASVQTTIGAIMAEQQRLDVVLNLVGGFAAGQPVTALDLVTWQRMLDLNVRSALLVSKHAGSVMAQRGEGCILNISSRGARTGRKHAAAYAIAKGAIITLTEVQAEEMRDQGVRVNCILPSIIDTPANRASMPGADYARWPRAEDVARVLLFLASDDAKLISGAAIPVYGLA
ncbi:MAG TPA: SDR family oxidoreductase [Ktedonobacterales bacterium]|nr:SDR family oxidoreductase [Ktedonobacterales bacterium]